MAKRKKLIENRWILAGTTPQTIFTLGLQRLSAHIGQAQVAQALQQVDPELSRELAGASRSPGLSVSVSTPPLKPSFGVGKSPKAPGLSPVASRLHLDQLDQVDELTML